MAPPHFAHRPARTALLGASLVVAAAHGSAQEPAAEPARSITIATATPRLTEGQTRLRVIRYGRTEGWALRGLVLLSLGPDWHPLGAEIVLDALRSDERELRLFALEALMRTRPTALRCVLDADLIDLLVDQELRDESLAWQLQVVRILRAAFPDVSVTSPAGWRDHWRSRGPTHEPEEWIAPELDPDARSVAASAVDRAFDLEKAGLELVLCVDSTGSMQGTIDAAASACDDLVRVLASFSPKVRVGLVHYRDLEDMPGGAARLLDLTPDHDKLRAELDGLMAGGGGDFPERVEKGIALALDEQQIDWTWGANKLVVVVGDAPPHDASLGDLMHLVRETSRRSRGRGDAAAAKSGDEGRSKVPRGRPCSISCIGVGAAAVAPQTQATFRVLSRAGGGTYVPLTMAGAARAGESPSDRILEHVLRFSFGPNAGEELDSFIEVLLRGRRRGWLR